MEDDSSIPPLPLSSLSFPPPPRLHNELKQRLASQLTLTDILELPPITEETTDRLSTGNAPTIQIAPPSVWRRSAPCEPCASTPSMR